MTTAMSDVDRTSMRCTVCRQLCRGRKPKILPCSHTFCVKCLESLVRTPHAENIEGFTESTEEFSKLVITCPTCMKVFPVPIGGVKCFLSNSYLDDETGLETDKPVPLCDFCEGNHTAKDNCKECKSKFCVQCRETHNMICPEREVIPLCSKPLATLQAINNGYLGIESVREQIEVLEAVLSRLDEEEVEVEHQKHEVLQATQPTSLVNLLQRALHCMQVQSRTNQLLLTHRQCHQHVKKIVISSLQPLFEIHQS